MQHPSARVEAGWGHHAVEMAKAPNGGGESEVTATLGGQAPRRGRWSPGGTVRAWDQLIGLMHMRQAERIEKQSDAYFFGYIYTPNADTRA